VSAWRYSEPTEVIIVGQPHVVQMAEGMTGIGSRAYYVDGKAMFRDCVTQSEDLASGNHSVYTIKWRDTPWDRVDIIIHESEVPWLLSDENKWREPTKIDFNPSPK